MSRKPSVLRSFTFAFIQILFIAIAYSQSVTGVLEKIRAHPSEKLPLAEGQSKFLGCVYSTPQSTNFTSYWNQVTPENAGKWGHAEPGQDNMNWTALDEAYQLAKDNGFPFRFHVLIWGNQQPGWIESLSPGEQLEEIEEWFAAVAERYPDIDYLEVVNEPLHDPPDEPGNGGGNYINALGGTNDLYNTGWDWVIRAFELARSYFPASTKLMINECNIVNNSESTTTYVQIINLLIERGLIDGIGVQGHAFSTGVSALVMKNNLDKLAETGLPIQVCEMDVDGPTDETQLTGYKRIFPAFWEHAAVEGITLWGWRRGLWRDNEGAYLINDRGGERPALQWLRQYIIAPKAPMLVSPANLETDVPRDPVLTWQASDSAITYRVQISRNSAFTEIILDSTVADTCLSEYLLKAKTRYYWRASAANENGTSEFSTYARFTTGEQINSGTPDDMEMPAEYILFHNCPNPFNPSTLIRFSVPCKTSVSLTVTNIKGETVFELNEKEFSAGMHSVTFNGSYLATGHYFYTLQTDDFMQTRKMILSK